MKGQQELGGNVKLTRRGGGVTGERWTEFTGQPQLP